MREKSFCLRYKMPMHATYSAKDMISIYTVFVLSEINFAHALWTFAPTSPVFAPERKTAPCTPLTAGIFLRASIGHLIQKKTCQAEKNRGNAAVWLCSDWVFCHCWKRTFSVSEASCFQDIGTRSSYVKFWMILLQLCSLRFLRRGKKFNEFLELLEEVHGKPE